MSDYMKANTFNFKVDIISNYFFPVAAGIEQCILNTNTVLAKKGWDITVHTSADTLDTKNILVEKEYIRGLKVRRYKKGILGFFPKINWARTNIVNLNNFNVFPHFFILLHVLFLKITGRKKFALIFSPHGGVTPAWNTFPVATRTLKKAYHLTIGAFLINYSVDAIHSISEWEKEEMIKSSIRPDLITVIENGHEEEALEDPYVVKGDVINSVQKFGKYIISVGRIHKVKNYEVTLKALALLPAKINYVIVGPVSDRKYFQRLKKLISKLKLDQRVFFAGVLRGQEKYYVLRNASAMVHMAHWESFCNCIREGMMQGLICITSNKTILPTIIKDGSNGFVVGINDHPKLAHRIKYILENPSLKVFSTMREVNKGVVLPKNWTRIAEEISLFYTTILYKFGYVRGKLSLI